MCYLRLECSASHGPNNVRNYQRQDIHKGGNDLNSKKAHFQVAGDFVYTMRQSACQELGESHFRSSAIHRFEFFAAAVVDVVDVVVIVVAVFAVVAVVAVAAVVVVVVVVPSDPSFARIFSDVLPNGNRVFMCISHTGRAVSCIWRRGLFLLTFCALNDTLHDIHTSHMSNAWVHTLHMPKPNVTRAQGATEWTASVHTLHMPKPNVTRVHSATEWTASVHTLHTPKPNVTRVHSATEWTASVHTLHMPKLLTQAFE